MTSKKFTAIPGVTRWHPRRRAGKVRRTVRRGLLVAASVATVAALSVLTPGPAMADDTTVTFVVQGAGLAVVNPTTASLGSGLPGAAISAALGPVTVTDARALLGPSWIATVASTAFTTGGGTPPRPSRQRL